MFGHMGLIPAEVHHLLTIQTRLFRQVEAQRGEGGFFLVQSVAPGGFTILQSIIEMLDYRIPLLLPFELKIPSIDSR